MATEHRSARFANLDAWDSQDILAALFEGQLAAAAAVRPALPAIAGAADAAVARLRRGGRLIYAGAGTSGRIGVQDGAELPPTFNWPEHRVAFALAGGEAALLTAVEDAEDSEAAGAARMVELAVGADDVVIGLAASGTTPYTVAALREARARGAQTVGVANNADVPVLAVCTHPILAETGEEVIAGSTRMKAGTAQKIVLNLFSSLVMIRLGRVYGGLMVHMRTTNAKLRRRGAHMVSEIAGCALAEAEAALARTNGDVKLAALVASGVEPAEATAFLASNGDDLRRALAALPRAPATPQT
ncbi:MAG TPA: N-acetylmuramic acid 6-phosphate etherase [Microvirga sp.]|jgi:N-acetylmuramic acid 6-phosphate etherase|nr:N-acetylmuramic acid 6-phosphate etherase [Microvirga sp.]